MRKNIALMIAGLALAGCPSSDTPPAGGNTSAPPPPPPPPPPVAVSTPTVDIAPDHEFDKAKKQPGHDKVKGLKNPFAGKVEETAKGAELFKTNCASCHGEDGATTGPAGMALTPKPRNLTLPKEYLYGPGELGIFRTAKYGTEGTGMTPWEGRMPDEDIWRVVNFVRTLQK